MGNKISLLRHDLGQIFWLPPPPLTEHNLSDQTGKVYIVTGGYAGVGLELASLLYRKNATGEFCPLSLGLESGRAHQARTRRGSCGNEKFTSLDVPKTRGSKRLIL